MGLMRMARRINGEHLGVGDGDGEHCGVVNGDGMHLGGGLDEDG